MARPGNADLTVYVVDDAGDADENVIITGAYPVGPAGGDLEGTYPNPTIKPGLLGGGGASTPPGQAAHYIGTWDVAVAYAAGECVRQWDGAVFKLYQAKKATTADNPTSVVASWAEVTTPIVMWGAEDPNLTDAVNAHGAGIVAPFGTAYLPVLGASGDGSPGLLTFTDREDTTVQGVGFWDPSQYSVIDTPIDGVTAYWESSSVRQGAGSGDAYNAGSATKSGTGAGGAFSGSTANNYGSGAGRATWDAFVSRSGSGNGDTWGQVTVSRAGTGTGNAHAWHAASVDDTAVGVATAGAKATHHAGGEAHVLPTANSTRAWNDIKGDVEFTDNTEGPVIHDQTDGHTYRIVCTAGVLSTVLVT